MDEGRECDIDHRRPLHYPVAHVLLWFTVLARALGRQQDFLHDALSGCRAGGIGQCDLPAVQVMALRGRGAVGGECCVVMAGFVQVGGSRHR